MTEIMFIDKRKKSSFQKITLKKSGYQQKPSKPKNCQKLAKFSLSFKKKGN
jgi:hypothetical protein